MNSAKKTSKHTTLFSLLIGRYQAHSQWCMLFRVEPNYVYTKGEISHGRVHMIS